MSVPINVIHTPYNRLTPEHLIHVHQVANVTTNSYLLLSDAPLTFISP